QSPLDHRHTVPARQVGGQHLDLHPVRGGETFAAFGESVLVPCDQHQVVPFGGEPVRERCPDSGGRSGDQCHWHGPTVPSLRSTHGAGSIFPRGITTGYLSDGSYRGPIRPGNEATWSTVPSTICRSFAASQRRWTPRKPISPATPRTPSLPNQVWTLIPTPGVSK